jgi:hypothetical protein
MRSEGVIATQARNPGGGLITMPSAFNVTNRDLIIALAARYGVPAIYFNRLFAKSGGLINYSPDYAEQLRQVGVCLMPTRGFGNPEVAAAFARGAELAEQSDDARGLFVSLRGRGQYHFVSGDLRACRADTQRVMALAERMGDHDCLLEAHHLCWSAFCFTGEFAAAQQHVEAGIARYQRDRDHHLTSYGQKIETIAKSESYPAKPRRLERSPCGLSSVILEATTGALARMGQRGH